MSNDGPPEPPVAGDETATLLGSLDRQRATLAWKCGGLDAAGMRATVGASTITLGGLLKHLALVEDDYFSRRLLGRELGAPWDTVDWDADPDWEWHSAAEDTPEQLMTLWQDAVARSRSAVTEALADGDLGQLAGSNGPTVGHPACGDPDRPDRGVRAARRPCRPHPGIGGRARRGRSAALATLDRDCQSRTQFLPRVEGGVMGRRGSAAIVGVGVCIAVMSGAGAALAAPGLIKNGGFEKPAVPMGAFVLFATGSSFSDWYVVGAPGNVAVVSTTFVEGGFTFPAKSGCLCLDLTGSDQHGHRGLPDRRHGGAHAVHPDVRDRKHRESGRHVRNYQQGQRPGQWRGAYDGRQQQGDGVHLDGLEELLAHVLGGRKLDVDRRS